MRRIMTFDNVSADGYFSASDGNLEWVVPDEEVFKTAAESMPDVDTMLFGRRTYEQFESFWPHALDDSTKVPHRHTGGQTPGFREQAVWINETPKIVFSKSLEQVTWKNSRVIRELDPRAIETMKKQSGKDMIVFGSGSVVSQLTEHGLIDEYLFVVNPVVIGNGRPLISGLPRTSKLRLLKAKELRSGNVMLRYAPAA